MISGTEPLAMHLRAHLRVVWCTILALFAMTAPATANFDAWRINEIYSNADGSIQFIELYTIDDNQDRLLDEAISSSLSSYLFDVDLPSDLTAGLFFLVGTASYVAAPGAVAPDYTVPDNFFSVSSDTINFASVDAVGFGIGDLPLDGLLSIDRNLVTSPNSPTNFAGQSGQVVLAPEPSTILLIASGLAALAVGRKHYRV